MDITFEVLHAIPGRVRLRIPETRDDPEMADKISQSLLRKTGITWVRANTACASVTIGYDTTVLNTFIPAQHLRGLRFHQFGSRVEAESPCNGGQGKLDKLKALLRRFAALILPSAALIMTIARRALPIAPMYGIVAAAAAPVFRRAALTICRERRLGVDFLDATAIAIMGIQRNLPTCAFMAWLISIGEHIREETARKSEKAIADLVAFHSDSAIMLVRGKRMKVPVSCLSPGDHVVVNAGDYIPVDGCVIRGRAGVDQMSLTGESVLAERSAGDTVFAGSIAVDGELVIEATAVGLNTRAGKIVEILRSTPVQETKIEDYAARFADRLVLPTFAISGAVFALSRSVSRALSMLIVDFGTGVRVAAPTAFLSFMVHAAHRNIVVKGGRAMEKLAHTDAIVFDKTGTLTAGAPAVNEIIPLDRRYSERGIIKLAAAAEAGLNHPVASALAAAADEMGVRLPNKIGARLRVGLGVKAELEGKHVLVGRERLMHDEHVDVSAARHLSVKWERGAKSPLYIAVNGKLVGIITYADRIRPESAEVIEGLKALGVDRVIMATGDREEVARTTSLELGIDTFISGAFPEKKLDIVKELQRAGRTVAVVGDGINDSLALANADVAVATAGATDAAKEAADILLMADDLRLLLEAFAIARSAVSLVRQNFGIVAAPNAAAIALAAAGLLGPPGATLVNNGSTVAAGLNGLRPLLRNSKNGNGYKRVDKVCPALPGGREAFVARWEEGKSFESIKEEITNGNT